MIKNCFKHGETEFGKYGCKKCNYEFLDNARRRYKHLLIEYKGSICEKCGKKFRDEVFDFHHVNPKEKEFGIGSFKVLNLEKLKKEADKCMLLCSNCHRELHAELHDKEREERLLKEAEEIRKIYINKVNGINVKNPHKYLPYEEIMGYISENMPKKTIASKFNVKLKTINKFLKENNITYREQKVVLKPTKEELISLLEKNNFCKIGRMFGVSDNAVRKWCVKYNINYKKTNTKLDGYTII